MGPPEPGLPPPVLPGRCFQSFNLAGFAPLLFTQEGLETPSTYRRAWPLGFPTSFKNLVSCTQSSAAKEPEGPLNRLRHARHFASPVGLAAAEEGEEKPTEPAATTAADRWAVPGWIPKPLQPQSTAQSLSSLFSRMLAWVLKGPEWHGLRISTKTRTLANQGALL